VDVIAVDPADPDPAVLERAARLLRDGKLVIYPTDTLYALGAPASHPRAAARVRAAKGRDEAVPLPLVAADLWQARSVAETWPDIADRLAARFWPGPLTIVVAARPMVPTAVTSDTGTVAVRIPDSTVARRLCAAAGVPLVSTSANRTGAPAPLTCADAVAAVGASAALALDGGPGRPLPSTIVDLTREEPRLLRAGAIEWAAVLEVLR
jgi:L-threonylcarbamoyladenylate synthase